MESRIPVRLPCSKKHPVLRFRYRVFALNENSPLHTSAGGCRIVQEIKRNS